MDFTLSEEQKTLAAEIISFAGKNLNDEEGENVFSSKQWKKVSDFGLLGLTIGEEYEGLGESFLTAAAAIEALGYSCTNNGFVFVINNHIWVAQNLIYLYGNKLLKDNYIPQMITGNKIGAFALTEPESGSDALAMKTKADALDEYYILNGTKMFISNGPIADIFIVFALTGTDPNRYTAFVVERNFPGVSTGPEIKKMGLDSCPTSELILQNCKVPKENILGYLNMGTSIMTAALEWERCYEFAPHVGAMQRIMERCVEHVNERKQFNRPIKEYQAISHKIADMKAAIEISRMMLYRVGWLKDTGKSAFLEASIFKLYVSENYIKTCQNAMQIFGAYGYSKEYRIERELRDALACTIYSGTSEIQRNTIFSMVSVQPYYGGESL